MKTINLIDYLKRKQQIDQLTQRLILCYYFMKIEIFNSDEQ